MATIAALTSIRNAALDKADFSETVLAMNLYFGLARQLGLIIRDLEHGLISGATTAKAGWAKIVIDDRAAFDDERREFRALLPGLRDLGITVIQPSGAVARRPASSLPLAA